MRKILAGLAGGLLIVSAAVGCTTERRTVRRETETVVPQTPPRVDEDRTVIPKRHTETIETED